MERNRDKLYVLAHVRRSDLADFYLIPAENALKNLVNTYTQAVKPGLSVSRINNILASDASLVGQFEEAVMLIRLVSGSSVVWDRLTVVGCKSEA